MHRKSLGQSPEKPKKPKKAKKADNDSDNDNENDNDNDNENDNENDSDSDSDIFISSTSAKSEKHKYDEFWNVFLTDKIVRERIRRLSVLQRLCGCRPLNSIQRCRKPEK